MSIKVLILLCISKVYHCSIAGVTYMDDFDFEQRYRNLHECDPFYWHPLHLPEECVEMFAKLIRSRIIPPYRVVQERQPYEKYDFNTYQYFLNTHLPSYRQSYDDIEPTYRVELPTAEIVHLHKERPRTPMDKLFNLLKRDVEDIPSAAKITTLPYLGGVALYRQPVSFKTEAMIKKLSQAYANAAYFR